MVRGLRSCLVSYFNLALVCAICDSISVIWDCRLAMDARRVDCLLWLSVAAYGRGYVVTSFFSFCVCSSQAGVVVEDVACWGGGMMVCACRGGSSYLIFSMCGTRAVRGNCQMSQDSLGNDSNRCLDCLVWRENSVDTK